MSRVLRIVWLLLLLPSVAWGQNVLRRHVGLVNPLDFGTSCTTATLNAAISGAPSGQGVLMLTPVDRNGAACTWTITSNVTIPTNLVLAVPHGAKASVSAGVTLTMVRCPREDNEDWRTGAGTYTVIEDPFPGTPGRPAAVSAISPPSGRAPRWIVAPSRRPVATRLTRAVPPVAARRPAVRPFPPRAPKGNTIRIPIVAAVRPTCARPPTPGRS